MIRFAATTCLPNRHGGWSGWKGRWPRKSKDAINRSLLLPNFCKYASLENNGGDGNVIEPSQSDVHVRMAGVRYALFESVKAGFFLRAPSSCVKGVVIVFLLIPRLLSPSNLRHSFFSKVVGSRMHDRNRLVAVEFV